MSQAHLNSSNILILAGPEYHFLSPNIQLSRGNQRLIDADRQQSISHSYLLCLLLSYDVLLVRNQPNLLSLFSMVSMFKRPFWHSFVKFIVEHTFGTDIVAILTAPVLIYSNQLHLVILRIENE